jgi:hypothetical protein
MKIAEYFILSQIKKVFRFVITFLLILFYFIFNHIWLKLAASLVIDDWGTEFGGGNHDVGGTTTELDGLPPPPVEISGSATKSKGMNNYKHGQFTEAIKWLSWTLIILEKAGDGAGTADVLSC